jgi:hypothetical protein
VMDQLLIHPFLEIWESGIESWHLANDWEGHMIGSNAVDGYI